MKTFKEHLNESAKKYDFRVKIAGPIDKDMEDKLKSVLGRFTNEHKLGSVKKSVTPIQALPLDFPQIKNTEVTIFEFTLDYPTTQQSLIEYISQELNLAKNRIMVKRPGEPTEEYQEKVEKREGALLDDPDYKEAGNPKFENYYGDKYNSGFVKELTQILAKQRGERGEQIPMEQQAKFNTDAEPGKFGPVSGKGK